MLRNEEVKPAKKSPLSSEFKWGIAAGVCPGIPLAGPIAAAKVVLDTRYKFDRQHKNSNLFYPRRLPYPAGEALEHSWNKYGLLRGCYNPRLLQFPKFSITAISTIALCGTIGFFAKKVCFPEQKTENTARKAFVRK